MAPTLLPLTKPHGKSSPSRVVGPGCATLCEQAHGPDHTETHRKLSPLTWHFSRCRPVHALGDVELADRTTFPVTARHPRRPKAIPRTPESRTSTAPAQSTAHHPLCPSAPARQPPRSRPLSAPPPLPPRDRPPSQSTAPASTPRRPSPPRRAWARHIVLRLPWHRRPRPRMRRLRQPLRLAHPGRRLLS